MTLLRPLLGGALVLVLAVALAGTAAACSLVNNTVEEVLGEIPLADERAVPSNVAIRAPSASSADFVAAGIPLVRVDSSMERLSERATGPADTLPPSAPTVLRATTSFQEFPDPAEDCFGSQRSITLQVEPSLDDQATPDRLTYALFFGATGSEAREAATPDFVLADFEGDYVGTQVYAEAGAIAAPGAWVRVVFLDQAGNASASSEPVEVDDTTPTEPPDMGATDEDMGAPLDMAAADDMGSPAADMASSGARSDDSGCSAAPGAARSWWLLIMALVGCRRALSMRPG